MGYDLSRQVSLMQLRCAGEPCGFTVWVDRAQVGCVAGTRVGGFSVIAPFSSGRIHYAWIVAGVTFLVLLASAGIRSAATVMMVPLEQEFGWDRATISFAISLNIILFGLCGPFTAAVMDRVGFRKVMVSALAVLVVAISLTTQMTAAWQLVLLWGVLGGLGSGAMAGALAATVANRWFAERRGLVMGLLTASNATGQLIFLPILATLVVNLSWRPASLLVASVALLVMPLVAIFMRGDPREVGVRPFGDDALTPLPDRPRPTGNPFSAAIGTLTSSFHSRDFWFLAGSFFICGASTNGLIGTHLIPASMEHGIPEVTAASMLALIGIFDLVGTTVSGWLSDRFDNRKLLVWYYGLRGLSLLFLPYAYGTGYFGLLLFIVFYGLDWVATVPPTVRLTADIFGKERVGIVFGWIMAAHQLGAGTVAFLAGVMHSWFGDYQAAFMTSGMLCLAASCIVVRIGRSPARGETVDVPAPAPVIVPAGSLAS
jgi:sugar phosphate permease